jgi:hypothetical protein
VRRRLAAIAVAVVALAVLAPDAALAHGISGREDLPIPRWLFSWAAAVVLVVSFVALATLWPRPRWSTRPSAACCASGRARGRCGALGVAAFAFVVYAGFAGTRARPPTSRRPSSSWSSGSASRSSRSCWATSSPPSAHGARRRAPPGWLAARVGARPPAPLAYPERLGHWPAAVGILAFAWVELGYVNRDDPSTLAVLALLYAAAQLVGISLYGVDAWTQRADAFGAAFGLYARLAPLHWRERALFVRAPLSGAPRLLAGAGTAALLAALLGTTSFDGFSNTELWSGGNGLAVWLQQRFVDVGLSAEAALELAVAVGLVAMVAFVWAIFRLGSRACAPSRAASIPSSSCTASCTR